ELKRVIVAYQNQIVMADTLDAALGRIFGGGGSAAPKKDRESLSGAPPQNDSRSNNSTPAPSATQQTLAVQARDHYQRALQAQREGNWALYGEEDRLLGGTLQGMTR